MKILGMVILSVLSGPLLYNAVLFAQTGETAVIKGIVKLPGGSALANANIGLAGTNKGTTTAPDGTYELTGIPAGEYVLTATFIGYEDASREVLIRPGQVLEVDLELGEAHYQMPQVNILATRMDGIFETVPGAVTYISKQEIDRMNPVNTNEVLRRSPGVHVVEEEGAGMRMNLAIRGLDAARSRSTLILEDGIPLALAPYGEPEMYYSPVMDKMEGVEILKGSGSVLYGPQTIGGIVNFITTDPPPERALEVVLKGGSGDFFSGLMSYGNTFGRAGIQAVYVRKQAENFGPTMFRINDVSNKFKLQLQERSYLGVKVGVYDEESNSTYVGMTQPMYESGEYDFVRISPHDRLNIRRYNLSASHDYYLNDNSELTTTVFGYTTTRNWQRQDFTYNSFDENGNPNPVPENYVGITWGDESIEEGAIYMLSGSGNRNRTYEIAGAESRLTTRYRIGSMLDNEFTGGLRFLYERAFEQRINGNKPDAPSGQLVHDEIRTGHGKSAYVHNRFSLSRTLSVTGGLRIEWFNDSRDIRRSMFGSGSERQVRDTSVTASNSLVELIPGAGFNLKATPDIGIFGGIHRGFAPPRTKDAISGEGEVYELAAEKSWNYELGLRAEFDIGIRYEITGFYMDFANQVIPVAEHAGGVGAGATNAGATFHRGVETSVVFDVGKILNWERLNFEYDANIGYVQARFNSERYMDDGSGGRVNVMGNRTPYAPEWLVSTALTLGMQNGIAARITGTYTSEQFTDPVNRTEPLNNGRDGLMPAYKLLDVNLQYPVSRMNAKFNAGVKNMLNERYIASRRPQGIMPGTPRLFTAGISFNF